MNKSYVIQWKSTVNGRAGRGTKLFEKEEAERLVEELNREYPQIHHEIVDSNSLPDQPATNSEKQSATAAEIPVLSVI